MVKKAKKIAAKDADQYMLRLPPGLRDRVAKRATENGRSMNTEIIEAIEKHLEAADRVTELSDFLRKHRESIEAIDHLWGAIEDIEQYLSRTSGGISPQTLSTWSQRRLMQVREKAQNDAAELAHKHQAKESPPK